MDRLSEKTEEMKVRLFEPNDGSEGHPSGVVVIVLGIAHYGGHPVPACASVCCQRASNTAVHIEHHLTVDIEAENARKYVSALAIIDLYTKQRWLVDCTSDVRLVVSMASTS